MKDKIVYESILDSLINHIPYAIFWKNKSLVFAGCNKQFAKQFGYTLPEEIIGKTDDDFPFPPKLKEKYHRDDRKVLAGISKINYEETQRQLDGSDITVLVSKVPLLINNEVHGVLGIYNDITDLKKMEKNLQQARIKAEAASKAKSEFIASISHDTKIPLTGIIGTARILEEILHTGKEKQFVQSILKCGEQLLHLFTSILDNVSIDHADNPGLNVKSFDLREMLNEIIELEFLTARLKNIELKTDIDEQVPHVVSGDRFKLYQILLNLIGNALKFTEKGYIKTTINLVSKNNDDIYLKFSVEDTGVGIPRDIQDKVFERFFTANPTYKGLYKGHGIGLNTVQKYVDLLGGEVKLTSKVGEGTTFYFTIPMKIVVTHENPEIVKKTEYIPQHQPEMVDSVANLVESSEENTYKVLLIEDDNICATIAKSMLEKINCNVLSVTSAESALQLAKQKNFDLILLDIGLPAMSGDEFAAALRQWERVYQKPATPIIALTGHADPKLLMVAGINAILAKPTDIQALKKSIDALFQKEEQI